jgi:hypothetical protein
LQPRINTYLENYKVQGRNERIRDEKQNRGGIVVSSEAAAIPVLSAQGFG